MDRQTNPGPRPARPPQKENDFRGFFDRRVRGIKGRLRKRRQGDNYITFWSGDPRRRRLGIYVYGGCDLMAIFAAEARIRAVLNGTCCLYRGGIGASSARSDILLQTLADYPREVLAPVMEKLSLPAAYFRPHLFGERFEVPQKNGFSTYRKQVIALSIAPDVVRTAYQHREHGFLVDPGGWWLNQNMENVLADMQTVAWFQRSFRKLGRLDVEESISNWGRIIALIREKTTAEVVLFNTLGVEPGDRSYDYQFVRRAPVIRRRQFNLALYELSRQLDFSIVDIDRLLKREGVQQQVDFAHWPIERFDPIAEEFFAVLQELGVLE